MRTEECARETRDAALSILIRLLQTSSKDSGRSRRTSLSIIMSFSLMMTASHNSLTDIGFIEKLSHSKACVAIRESSLGIPARMFLYVCSSVLGTFWSAARMYLGVF